MPSLYYMAMGTGPTSQNAATPTPEVLLNYSTQRIRRGGAALCLLLGGAQAQTAEPRTHRTVESEEPVTMTRSSYCRQRTEPVCPVNTFKHSRLVLSQIYGDKIRSVFLSHLIS